MLDPMKIVIISGSDEGILCIKELNPESDETLLLKDGYPNFSICGLPFYISGEVLDCHGLAHRNRDQLMETSMRFMLYHYHKGLSVTLTETLPSMPSLATVPDDTLKEMPSKNRGSKVSKRIDITAAALFSSLKATDLPFLDLFYTTPLSSPWNSVQTAAFEFLKRI